LAVSKTNVVCASQVLMNIIRNIFTFVKNAQFDECVVLVEMCLAALKSIHLKTQTCRTGDDASKTPSAADDARICLLCMCWMLNNVYFGYTESQHILRKVALQIIYLLNDALDVDLSKHLEPEVLAYFRVSSMPSIRDLVQQAYGKVLLETIRAEANFSMDDGAHPRPESLSKIEPLVELRVTESSSHQVLSEVIRFLPFILKAEFPSLFQVLIKLNSEDAEDKNPEPELKSLSIISCAVRTLFSASVYKGCMEHVSLGYCSLYTNIIKKSNTEYLLKLFKMIVTDIFYVHETSTSERVTSLQLANKDIVCTHLWASCQAAVAQLLLKSPNEEEVKAVLIPLCALPATSSKQTLLMMVENYVNV